MIGMLISAYSVGILVSVAPGAITVATVQRTISDGYKHALLFSIGVAASDIVYLLLVYFGLHALLAGNELIRAALFLLSGAWMGWMGFCALRQHFHLDQFLGCKACASYRRTFQMGFVMNLLNPLTIVGWAAIAGNFFNTWSLQWPPIMPFGLFAITNMFVAVLTWQLLLILLFHSIRKLINATFLHSLSIFGGALLIVCGLGAWGDAYELMVRMLG